MNLSPLESNAVSNRVIDLDIKGFGIDSCIHVLAAVSQVSMYRYPSMHSWREGMCLCPKGQKE